MSTTTEVGVGADVLVVRLECVAGGASVVMSSAGVSRGCRYLSGYLDVEGRIGGCRFGRLHVEVKEAMAGFGEWRVWISRTPSGRTYDWQSLTSNALAVARPEVASQVWAAGVDEAWQAAFRSDRDGYYDPAGEAAQARRAAAWWDEVRDLTADWRAGRLGYVPVGRDRESNRAPRVDVIDPSHDGRVSWEEAAGKLTHRVLGDQHGWVTESGRLVPLESAAPLRVRP